MVHSSSLCLVSARFPLQGCWVPIFHFPLFGNIKIAIDCNRNLPTVLGRAVKIQWLLICWLIFFQRIAVTVNTLEQKRLLTDLDVSMRSSDCPYTVQFYGALFREGDVWICMEVMDTSLDKFYPKVYKNNRSIPENILGAITVAVSSLDLLLKFQNMFFHAGDCWQKRGNQFNNYVLSSSFQSVL